MSRNWKDCIDVKLFLVNGKITFISKFVIWKIAGNLGIDETCDCIDIKRMIVYGYPGTGNIALIPDLWLHKCIQELERLHWYRTSYCMWVSWNWKVDINSKLVIIHRYPGIWKDCIDSEFLIVFEYPGTGKFVPKLWLNTGVQELKDCIDIKVLIENGQICIYIKVVI